MTTRLTFGIFLKNKNKISFIYAKLLRSAGCVIYELISLEKFANFESKDKQLNTVIPRKLAELVKL